MVVMVAMHIGDSDSGLKRVSEYSMGNQKLEYCDTEHDLLGVVMSIDLKVGSQCLVMHDATSTS